MTSPFALIGYWIAAATAVWISTAAIALSPLQSLLYQRVYGGNMGHHVFSQLGVAAAAEKPVCLLVGLSTTRAGLLPSVLDAEVPGVQFVEVAAAGGSIYGVELIVDMLRERRLRPACIVLGLHTHLLKDRTLGLWPAGFLDVMSPRQQMRFIPHEVADERTRTLIEAGRRAAWPAIRVTRQISALWRDTLADAQPLLAWRSPLPRGAFERFANELAPFDQANPALERAFDAQQRQQFWIDMQRQRLLDADTYGRPEHVESLAATITESVGVAPLVVAAVLPETAEARARVSSLANAAFDDTLTKVASPRLVVFDDRATIADDRFDVAFHLLHSGGEEYSRQFARRLAPLLRK